jgi:hypothetical protein
VSSELERILREAREALPAPEDGATLRARRRTLATVRKSRTRARVLVLVGATLAAAVALGVTAGSLNAPTGTAAREPAVLGFVPEPGWFALQSPPPAVPGQQTVAVAANVPFAADDVVHGLVEPSGLPYSTLLLLPPHGIVIVVTATPNTDPHLAPIPTNPTYARTELPLRIRDAVPHIQWGAQVRPDQPLASYQLRAEIEGVNLDVALYFGTSTPTSAMRTAAQRQLQELVIRSKPAIDMTDKTRTAGIRTTLSVIDRTYSCGTVFVGGIYQIESRAHSGRRVGSQWAKLPYAVVASGGVARTPGVDSVPANSLAWITAGTPSLTTTIDDEWLVFTVRAGGTLGVNRAQCDPAGARVPLSNTGLRGGPAGSFNEAFNCDVPKRVFVRFRATVRSSVALRERAQLFLATNAPAREAKLAVRTPAGKLLVYADVSESGKARLFTAQGCTQE